MKKKTIGPNKKILKLQPVLESRNIGVITVPELRLRGIWLSNNGFEAGKYVEVTYGKEYIVIYPLEDQTGLPLPKIKRTQQSNDLTQTFRIIPK